MKVFPSLLYVVRYCEQLAWYKSESHVQVMSCPGCVQLCNSLLITLHARCVCMYAKKHKQSFSFLRKNHKNYQIILYMYSKLQWYFDKIHFVLKYFIQYSITVHKYTVKWATQLCFICIWEGSESSSGFYFNFRFSSLTKPKFYPQMGDFLELPWQQHQEQLSTTSHKIVENKRHLIFILCWSSRRQKQNLCRTSS